MRVCLFVSVYANTRTVKYLEMSPACSKDVYVFISGSLII